MEERDERRRAQYKPFVTIHNASTTPITATVWLKDTRAPEVAEVVIPAGGNAAIPISILGDPKWAADYPLRDMIDEKNPSIHFDPPAKGIDRFRLVRLYSGGVGLDDIVLKKDGSAVYKAQIPPREYQEYPDVFGQPADDRDEFMRELMSNFKDEGFDEEEAKKKAKDVAALIGL